MRTLACLIFTALCGFGQTGQLFDSGGTRLRYTLAGEGEPVILVHSPSGNTAEWEPLSRSLSRRYQLIAIDGPREPGRSDLEMVNGVVRLMDHLKIRQAHIGGDSMSGSLVMKMLAGHPERLLTATVGGSADLSLPEFAYLKANRVPLLVYCGEKDNPERFAGLRSALPGAEFRMIAGSGRGSAPQTPQFLAYFLDFLDRHSLGPAAAQLPPTPAARQLVQWLQAYNSGSRALLSDFYERNYPAGRTRLEAEFDRRINLTGGFDLKQVDQCDAARCSAFLEMRDRPGYSRVRVALEPGQPDRVAELDTQPIPRPAGIPSERTTEAAAIDAFRSRLEIDTAADRFSGAVLVAHNGKVLFSQAYGLSDRAKKIPNTLQTRFRLGSMNKIFTAVAVLQLAEAGKIKLDDPLGKYLTDYPNRDLAAKVQIRHLLTHTGGTGEIFGPEFEAHRLELRTLRDYLDLYGKRDLEFEPGTRRAYSNYGFVLLGALVERVSGQSYYDYVRDHIFKPSGMTRSDSQPESEAVEGRAIGYTRRDDEEEWRTNEDTLPYRGTSAGGGYSTVEDLLKFALALRTHKLLSEHSFDLLVHGEPVTAGGRAYAFGSGTRNWEGAPYFGHNGGAPGMNTDLEVGLESGYVIAVLSNLDPPAAQRISEFIVSRLPEK